MKVLDVLKYFLKKMSVTHTEQSKFGIDKIKGLSPNHIFLQKSRWLYSMQSKFGMDKIQWSYKVGVDATA